MRDKPTASIFSHDDRARHLGIAYTPEPIVAAMLRWAATHGNPTRIVDAGAGTGRFAFAAAEHFKSAQILAIEIDAGSVQKLRSTRNSSPQRNRITFWHRDFLALETLPATDGPTLFIGNPPYVSHHLIGSEQKLRYRSWFAKFGLPQNSKAGLHLHFLVQVRRLDSPSDYGVFITAAEWMQASYGRALRSLLLDGMGGIAVDTFNADDSVFPDHMTTATVVSFQIGRPVSGLKIAEFKTTADPRFGQGTLQHSTALQSQHRWSATPAVIPALLR